MAFAAWLVWRADAIVFDKRAALFAFLVQLALNVGWSYAFFGLRSPMLGVGVIVILWMAIVWTGLAFRLVSTPAALLMVPYLAWVSFAAVLNIAIALHN
jgi:tryptophan-rich sensory protein